jgi:PfaB family protein
MAPSINYLDSQLNQPLAIVGMDVCLGSSANLGAFVRAIITGKGDFHPFPTARLEQQDAAISSLSTGASPSARVPGGYLESFDLDLSQAGLSPAELDATPPLHLLALHTALRALEDAGIDPGDGNPVRLGILTHTPGAANEGGDLSAHEPAPSTLAQVLVAQLSNLGNVSAVTREIPFEAGLLARSLATAAEMLQQAEIDAVLLIAAAPIEDITTGNGYAQDADVLSALLFDRNFNGFLPVEGAVAFVLKRIADARSSGARIHALVQNAFHLRVDPAHAVNNGNTVIPAAEIQALTGQALAATGLQPGDIGLLEWFSEDARRSAGTAVQALAGLFHNPGTDLTCAMSSADTCFGYNRHLTGFLSLARAAACLYHRIIPAAPDWSGPRDASLWAGSRFYVPTASRTWFTASARTALIASAPAPGSFTQVLLREEPPATHSLIGDALVQANLHLFPVAAPSIEGLAQQLIDLKQKLAAGNELAALSFDAYHAYTRCDGQAFICCILGSTPAEAQREIDFALAGVPRAVANGTDWQTPLGSYFTPAPLGQQGSIAFVYPGAFNSYPGVGQDVFFLYPKLFDELMRISADLGQELNEKQLYPRSLEALSKDDLAASEKALLDDPIAMLLSGTSLSVMFTIILRSVYKIKPFAAFGYSLGENSMMFSSGVWTNADEASQYLSTQPLFHTRLSGPMNAVRQAWGLPTEPDDAHEDGFWVNYVLMATPEAVSQALQGMQRVYLTHINTPRQVVIGGDPQECRHVIEALHCPSLKAPFDYALHCAAMASEYPALYRQHNWPVRSDPDMTLYSAADCQPVPIERSAIADRIARTLTTCVDFPRLIERVYADGARLFIELGAGANCSKWIDDTLKGRPYSAMAINRRGSDDHSSILRVLARLASHRVPFDLSPLYPSRRDHGLLVRSITFSNPIGNQEKENHALP